MNVGEYIVQSLIKQDIKHVFGIPGNQLTPILESLYFHRDKIAFVDCRNEAGASLMAEGYAKSSGNISVCLVSPGPGAANTYIGVLEAFTSCSPLLLITVRADKEFDEKGEERLFHGLDHVEAFRSITKKQFRLKRAKDTSEVMRAIFEQLSKGRPGPVLLEIQGRTLGSETGEEPPAKLSFSLDTDSDRKINEMARRVSGSKKPVILAGREVFSARAEKELLAFAKKINAPVLTTTMGKGVISDYEELSLGSILNYNYDKQTDAVFADSDLCIAIGVRFTQVDTESWRMKISVPLLTVSFDDKYVDRDYRSELSLLGDIKENLRQLTKMVEHSSSDSERIERLRSLDEPDNYQGVLRLIHDVMPENGILVNDVHIEGFSYARYRVRCCSDYIHSGLSLGIGYALPAAVGAQLAFPERKVIAFCGDGGFLMNSSELSTVMRYRVPITIIIVNDNGFGTIKRSQKEYIHDVLGLNLYNPDFMKLADSYHMKGYRVEKTTDVKAVINMANNMPEPVLVEIVKNWG